MESEVIFYRNIFRLPGLVLFIISAAICFLFASPSLYAKSKTKAPLLTAISTDKIIIDPQKGEKVSIRYSLSRKAGVRAKIYDSRNLLVRTLKSEGMQKPGDHQLEWKGEAENGKFVPNEAYFYMLEASENMKKYQSFDLTDFSCCEPQDARVLPFKPKSKKVCYSLPRPGRVRVLLGIGNGGPILRNLLDWVPRPGGLSCIPWDGWDSLRQWDFSRQSDLQIVAQSYAFPKNVIIVEKNSGKSEGERFLSGLGEKRPGIRSPEKQLFNYWTYPIEEIREIKVALVLPQDLSKNKSGVPIVSKPSPIRFEIAEKDRRRAAAENFELTFYIDGKFSQEFESGFAPFSWDFRPSQVGKGEHCLTVVLRGYAGRFGTATVKVVTE